MVAWIIALVDRVWEQMNYTAGLLYLAGERAMAEKLFKRGDQVTIRAPHLDGVQAEVLYDMIDARWVVRLSDANHPSGHSNEGALYAFAADQLEAIAPAAEVQPLVSAEGATPEVEL